MLIQIYFPLIFFYISASEESPQLFQRPAASGNAALDALIATAQREEPAAPQELEIVEIPAAAPVQQQQRPAGSKRRPAGSRRGLPRRRPRPERPAKLDENGQEVPRGRPRGGEQEEPTATLERYNHNNADGGNCNHT